MCCNTSSSTTDTHLIPQMEVVLFDEAAKLPSRGRVGDAGYDLAALYDITLAPGERALVGTGVGVAIPAGFAGFVTPRSGLAAKQGLTIVNSPGLVDSNYRGELKVALLNTDQSHPIHIQAGDRIAQLVIVPVATPELVLVSKLDTTERGTAGFGSSGR